MVVHLRDPRQSTISWVHYIAKIHSETGQTAGYPEEFFDMSVSERLTHDIETMGHFRHRIHWIDSWVTAEAGDVIDVQVMTFEDFVQDQSRYIEHLLRFFDIPIDRFEWTTDLSPTGATHFRTGRIDEWREVYTDHQLELANTLIPDAWFDRFGWQKS